MENIENKSKDNEKIEEAKKKIKYDYPLFYKKELVVMSLLVLFLTVLFAVIGIFLIKPADIVKIANIDVDKNLAAPVIIFSLIDGLIITIAGLWGKLVPQKPSIDRISRWIIYAILFLLGIAAYGVIVIGLATLGVSLPWSLIVANVIFSPYLYLMLKMYFFGYVDDKRIFYEIIRFALVGIIASIFDLTTCYLFEFIILPQSWPSIALTIFSVTCGFIVGVTVNYLCSVYMVFKATTSKDSSRTPFGRFMFVLLASVGLFMGYGLQWVFYDWLGIGYVLTFIIRTLIVLVWNYLSRKYFIFR